MNEENKKISNEELINKLSEIESSFDGIVTRLMDITDRQNDMHFKYLEKEGKRKHRKSIIMCTIICITIIIYQAIYMDSNSKDKIRYLDKVIDNTSRIEKLEERSAQNEKGSREDR